MAGASGTASGTRSGSRSSNPTSRCGSSPLPCLRTATRSSRTCPARARRCWLGPPPRPAAVPVVSDAPEVLGLRERVRRLHVADEVEAYVVALVAATRRHPSLQLGASPRASVALYRAAQAAAVLDGRDFVLADDVRSIA